MLRLAVVCLALAAAAPAVAQGREEQDPDPQGAFQYRGWAGSRLAGDKENGCVMGLGQRGGTGLVVYANAKGAFRIGLGDASLKLEPGKEALAAIVFDGSPPFVLKGSAVTPSTALFEPLDKGVGDGLEQLLESARSVRLTYDGHYLRAPLSGSSRALRLLRDCASAPDEPRRPMAGRPRDGAPMARAAEFGFLRQGMDAGEAGKKLIEAGWQSAGAAPGAGGADENSGFARLKAKGVTAQSCTSAPTDCVARYEDAYGNELRLTAAADTDAPTVKGWRLNPEDGGKKGEE